ncbi:hypothetical protein ACQCT3_11775 [Sutcliffiella horikoshii]|uniref:AbiU2 domain-containing protein n=1 Tax=Sutcliffiella horikoshii TaxID=79883 RepID=UPI003CEADC1A
MGTLTKEELSKFMEQLFMEVYHSNSKIELYMYMSNKFVDYPEVGNIAPSFFELTRDSLSNEFGLRIAKLFDSNGYGTLYKLLNLIGANVDLFPADKKKLILSTVSAHSKILKEDNAQLLKNLRTWRDKLLAHWDKNYFFNVDRTKLGEDAPMLYGELLTLLKSSTNIINFYAELLDKTHYLLETDQIKKDFDILFNALLMRKN